MAEVDVYPVGVLADLRQIVGAVRQGRRREAWSKVRYVVRCMIEDVRAGRWRKIRNRLNGYLAEPYDWAPYGAIGVRRCGSGWTRRRALRSLDRQVARTLRSQTHRRDPHV